MANNRANRIWLKLTECYGARLAENYGKTPPESWTQAIDELTDSQLTFGIRQVSRESPLHPPTLGQFVQACLAMPVAQHKPVATLQEQLCEYVAIKLHARLTQGATLWDYSGPWTYLYREWWDESRPKGFERCAECTGVVVECRNGKSFKFTVAEMQADTEDYQRMLRNFRPGPLPPRRTADTFPEALDLTEVSGTFLTSHTPEPVMTQTHVPLQSNDLEA
jgi:hypothetical protein